jgi:hypothetical protein
MSNNFRIASPANSTFVLFGLGGAGGKSLLSFAKMCALNPTFGREILSRTQFVLIDTDVGDLNKTSTEITAEMARVPGLDRSKFPVEALSIGRGLDKFEAAVSHDEGAHGWGGLPDNAPLLDAVWMRKDSAGANRSFKAPRCAVPPSKGASQCPMISSYLAMRKVKDIDEVLARVRGRIGPTSEGAKVRLSFVTSLAGGTGRGSWWIIASRARKFFNDSNPTGVFLDWTCFRAFSREIGEAQMPRLKVNSLTGFAELAMWLRLGMNETDDPGKAPNFTIPQLGRPQETDPHAAIISTRLLANPNNPTDEGTAGVTGRYPLRRAFVVTGDTDGVSTPPVDSAASILAGLLGLAKTDSYFNNETQWVGTGMTSVATVPLVDLRLGIDRQVQSMVLQRSLLAENEKEPNEDAFSTRLAGLTTIPSVANLLKFQEFAKTYLQSGEGGRSAVQTHSSVIGSAIGAMLGAAPVAAMRESMEEQCPPDEVALVEALWTVDADKSRAALATAMMGWVQGEIETSGGADSDASEVARELVAEDEKIAQWLLDGVTRVCRHGKDDDLFSLAVQCHVLKQGVLSLNEACKSLGDQMKALSAANRASANQSGSNKAPNTPRERIQNEIKQASPRNAIVPIWPFERYSEQEINDTCLFASYEYVRANLSALLGQYQARLDSIRTALGRAHARAESALSRVRRIAETVANEKQKHLGFDDSGRASEYAGASGGACRVLPADQSDRWDWLAREMKALRSMRGMRRFVLPRLLKSKDEFSQRDSVAIAAGTVEKTASRLAVELLNEFGVRPIHEKVVNGVVLKPEEIEKQKLDEFEQGLRRRLDGVALDLGAQESFEANCAFSRSLRSWAAAIGEIASDTISESVYRSVDEDCRHSLGFGLAEAASLAELSNEAKLLYKFVRRLSDDNDDPVLLAPSADGIVRPDSVWAMIPKRLKGGVEAALANDSSEMNRQEQLDFARADISVSEIESEHLIVVTKWSLIENPVFQSIGWSVWQSFNSHVDDELRTKYLGAVDDPHGSSVFEEPNGAVGLGYTAPMFIRRPEFASLLWAPWKSSTAAPKLQRRSFALLYAMLGISDGTKSESTSSQSVEKFLSALSGLAMSTESPSLRWTMPIMGFDPGASILRWSLMRSPFQPIGTGATVDFRAPNDAADRQFNRLFQERGGPVQFARALNSGEFDGFVDAVMTEHEVLMKLAARSPLMDHWNDAVRKHCAVYLRDMIQLRRTRVGESNREHHQIQMAFYDGLEQTLDWLQKQGRGVLDPFVH